MPTSNFLVSGSLSRLRIIAAASVVLLAACTSPQATTEPSVPPKSGLEFRIASLEPCLACQEIARTPPQQPLYLQPRPLLTSADIAGIAKAHDPISGSPALQFEFRQDARERIQTITAQHVGKTAAWVKDGQLVYEARISGPFSESMQLTGIEPAERDRLYGLLTGIKEPKALKQAQDAAR